MASNVCVRSGVVGVGAGLALLQRAGGDDGRLRWDVWPGNSVRALARAQGCSRLMAAGAAALDDSNNDNTAPRHVSKLSLRRMSSKEVESSDAEWKRGRQWQEKKASQPERCLTSFAGQSVQ